ncbi:hypothetical protein M7I_6462 [Glarea lozoyensis 74030]|uniref:HD domain-containing protein n=1 Tax=Glarea lozoyensis (strain ATCC 74030 / MF5533) TaxID=1104152 RepID=H0EUM5_GLAL7|nr:hypothetical protein M7I_6462 [Glarea lozoyensis 74030]
MEFKFTWIIVQLLVAFQVSSTFGFEHVIPRGLNNKPTRVIGGVTVIDTLLVRAAQAFARENSEAYLYNHVMRTWLFGALIISHNTTLQHSVDLEVHAIGSILHDLGLVLNATWISHDLRFEVDSSNRATQFVEETAKHHGTSSAWDANRLQLLYDAILLSSEPKFSLYKQATVKQAFGDAYVPGYTPVGRFVDIFNPKTPSS